MSSGIDVWRTRGRQKLGLKLIVALNIYFMPPLNIDVIAHDDVHHPPLRRSSSLEHSFNSRTAFRSKDNSAAVYGMILRPRDILNRSGKGQCDTMPGVNKVYFSFQVSPNHSSILHISKGQVLKVKLENYSLIPKHPQ